MSLAEQTKCLSPTLKLRDRHQKYPFLQKEDTKYSANAEPEIESTSKLSFYHSKESSPKNRINWNNSATSWTRDSSPIHGFTQAERFPKNAFEKQEQSYELYDLSSPLNKHIVKFPKSVRKQLFSKQTITPSPQHYNKKRYLQKLETTARSYRQIEDPEERIYSPEHIKGGTINKFDAYESLYYPQIKRPADNQKLIVQKLNERKMSLDVEKRGRSLRIYIRNK